LVGTVILRCEWLTVGLDAPCRLLDVLLGRRLLRLILAPVVGWSGEACARGTVDEGGTLDLQECALVSEDVVKYYRYPVRFHTANHSTHGARI
jgi:hypothetical protein